jgi:hypothetical protein
VTTMIMMMYLDLLFNLPPIRLMWSLIVTMIALLNPKDQLTHMLNSSPSSCSHNSVTWINSHLSPKNSSSRHLTHHPRCHAAVSSLLLWSPSHLLMVL